MDVDRLNYQSRITAPGESDGVSASGRPGVASSSGTSSSTATDASVTIAATPAVPWMDPALGGVGALGSPGSYLPALASLHQELSGRQDAVAQFGSAAIWDELVNHAVLNGHLNSLIS